MPKFILKNTLTMEYQKILIKLAQERDKKKLSALELSHRLGMSQNYIYEIEGGRSKLSLPSFLEICEILEIDPKELFN